MAWTTAGRNARADATAALITAVSLHTAAGRVAAVEAPTPRRIAVRPVRRVFTKEPRR